MKLEFIDDISAGGKFTGVVTDQLVRLYDFDKLQAAMLRQVILHTIIENHEPLDLSKVDFIKPINCYLTLRIADTDKGIATSDKINFICDLKISGYENMVYLLEPFCIKSSNGYQWLYDIDTPIEFLFSPGGTW
jgi:hypothetical protein